MEKVYLMLLHFMNAEEHIILDGKMSTQPSIFIMYYDLNTIFLFIL
jgi:hypothetical protein